MLLIMSDRVGSTRSARATVTVAIQQIWISCYEKEGGAENRRSKKKASSGISPCPQKQGSMLGRAFVP